MLSFPRPFDSKVLSKKKRMAVRLRTDALISVSEEAPGAEREKELIENIANQTIGKLIVSIVAAITTFDGRISMQQLNAR